MSRITSSSSRALSHTQKTQQAPLTSSTQRGQATSKIQSTQTDRYQRSTQTSKQSEPKQTGSSSAYGTTTTRQTQPQKTANAALVHWRKSGGAAQNSPRAVAKQAQDVIQEMKKQGVSRGSIQNMERTLRSLTSLIQKQPDLGMSSDPKDIAKQHKALTTLTNHIQSLIYQFAGAASTIKSPSASSSVSGPSKTTQSNETQTLEKANKKGEAQVEKKKGFWEKLFDFFKKAFSFLEKVLDFIMPLVAMIPGIGTTINAVYQGLKCLKCLIEGNYAGAVSALLGTLGAVGKMIGGAINTAIQIGTKVVKAVQGLVQAVKSGDPMAILSSVSSVVVGSLGQMGGMASKVAKGIQQGIGLAKAGVYTAQGIAEGNWDKALTGLSSAAGTASGMIGGSAGEVGKHISTAVGAVNHLAHGRVGAALSGATRSIQKFASTPETKEIFKGIQMGAQAIDSLVKGDYAAAASKVVNYAGGLSGNQDFKNVTSALSAGIRFADGIAKGSASQAMKALSQGVGQISQDPGLQSALNWGNMLVKLFETAQKQQPQTAAKTLQDSNVLKQLFKAAQDGTLSKGITSFAKALSGISNSPEFKKTMSWVADGSQFVQSLLNGNITSGLKTLQKSKNVPSELKTVLSTSQNLGRLFSGLLDGSLTKELDKLQQKQPDKAQAAQVKKLSSTLSSVGGLVQGLSTGTFGQSLHDASQLYTQAGNSLEQGQIAQNIQSFQGTFQESMQGFAAA